MEGYSSEDEEYENPFGEITDDEDADDKNLYPQGEIVATVKIFGGANVDPKAFPHQVSLKTPFVNAKGRTRYIHFCGATIIHPLILLTAAHCLVGPRMNISTIRAVAGEYDLSSKSGHEQIQSIQRQVIHHGWNDKTKENDIALLMLDQPLKFDDFTKPIPFAASQQNETGRTAHITGWGKTNNKGNLPAILQGAEVRMWNVSFCQSFYGHLDYKVTDNHICAGGLNDTCEGDSGGPLTCMTDESSHERYVCGITSWGRQKCARQKYPPGVYTDVSAYSQWILAKVRGMVQGQAVQAQGCVLSTSLAQQLLCSTCNARRGAPVRKPVIESVLVQVDIKQRYSLTQVTSTIVNPDSLMPQEVTFSIPFPESAVISGFSLAIDGTVHNACLDGNGQKSNQTGAWVRKQGQKATVAAGGVVESSIPNCNLFNFVKTVDPGSAVTFSVTYEELLRRHRGSYKQTVHIDSNAVRQAQTYNISVSVSDSAKIKWIRAFMRERNDNSQVSIDEELKDVGLQLQLNETAGRLKWSATESLKTRGGKLPQQFMLRFDTETEDAGQILVQDGHFVHFFPTQLLGSPMSTPKHFIFLLDTSSSMTGTKLAQVQNAMLKIWDELARNHRKDFFNIITFDQDVKVWTPSFGSKARKGDTRPIPMASRLVKQAKNYIQSLTGRASGWDLHAALKTALDVSSSRGGNAIGGTMAKSPFIFLITSATSQQPATGTVTNLDEIQARITTSNMDHQVPIFSMVFVDDHSVGHSASINLFSFLRKLSLQNYGMASKVSEGRDAVFQFEDPVLGISSSISVAGLSMTYSHPGTLNLTELAVTGNFSGYFFQGSDVVVAGKVIPAQANQANNSNVSPLLLTSCNNTVSNPTSGNSITNPGRPVQDLLKVIITTPSSWGDIMVYNTSTGFGNNNNSFTSTAPPNSAQAQSSTGENNVARLWAYLKLQDLLKESQKLRAMNDFAEWEKVAEHAQTLAVDYGFLTPWTYLVFTQTDDTELRVEDHVNDASIPAGGNGIAPTASSSTGSLTSPLSQSVTIIPSSVINSISLNVMPVGKSKNNQGPNNGGCSNP